MGWNYYSNPNIKGTDVEGREWITNYFIPSMLEWNLIYVCKRGRSHPTPSHNPISPCRTPSICRGVCLTRQVYVRPYTFYLIPIPFYGSRPILTANTAKGWNQFMIHTNIFKYNQILCGCLNSYNGHICGTLSATQRTYNIYMYIKHIIKCPRGCLCSSLKCSTISSVLSVIHLSAIYMYTKSKVGCIYRFQ